MKKAFVFSLLLLIATMIARSQFSASIVKVINGKDCDTCYVDGSFAYTEHLNYAILGAEEELVQRSDTLQKLNGDLLPNLSRHAISSPQFRIVFMPAVKKPVIAWSELEFRVLQNNRLIQDWKSTSLLPREKEYRILYGNNENVLKEYPVYLAGNFTLAITDLVLIQVHSRNQKELLRNISVERIKILPSIQSITQFPAGTGLQDILNKELNHGYTWVINDKEVEVEAGNSVLISFDRGMNNQKVIEYSFDDDPDNWRRLEKNKAPDQLPSYLYIEKPKPDKITWLKLRYASQPESVRRVKIIVKPKLSRSKWFLISASLVLAFLLFLIGYYVNRRKNKRQYRQLLLKKKDLENKLQLLSGLFNPHFLFNSLNSIQGLVNKADIDTANAYISQVAHFLRTVMDAGKKEFISLQEELEIAEGYLQLEQKKRTFTYSVHNAGGIILSQVDFPPLLLQPVLENSLQHGFTKEIPDPILLIEISRNDKELYVTITDNGKGFDPMTCTKGHGLDLVEKRIALMNEKPGNRIKMEINSQPVSGTITIFTFNNWI